jgi:hypothetical protein
MWPVASNAVSDLEALLAEHLRAPFPASVTKGLDYGEVDAVMIGADIYGWPVSVSRGVPLPPEDRQRLAHARDELSRSIGAFPVEARSYYQQLVDLADAALSA